MSTATKPKKSTPHPDTMPIEIQVPAEVAEISNEAAAKLNYRQQALDALNAAQQTLDQAETDDIAATREAVENGKPAPPSCLTERQEELKSARRTFTVANQVASEAVDHLEQAISSNSQELISTQRERAEATANKATEQLAALEETLTQLGKEAGLLHGLIHGPSDNRALRDRGIRGAPKIRRNFRPKRIDQDNHINALREAVTGIYENTAGMSYRILNGLREADKPLTNNQIAEALGVNPLDKDYREIKAALLSWGDIVQCDPDGSTERSSPYLRENPHYKLGNPKRRKVR